MSFQSTEQSIEAATPILLVTFETPDRVFRYTNHDVDYDYDGDTYLKASLKDNPGAYESLNLERSLTLDASTGFAKEYLFAEDTGPVTCTIVKLHTETLEAATRWVGQVETTSSDGKDCTIKMIHALTVAINKKACRHRYSAGCRNTVYDGLCGLDKSAYGNSTAITAISPNRLELTVTSTAGFPDEYYSNGTVTDIDSGITRLIISVTGLVLTLALPFPSDLAVSDSVKLTPGCDYTIKTCTTRFGNYNNFNGFTYLTRRKY